VTESPRKVTDRQVLILLALVVGAVLAADVLSGIIPGMDHFLAAAPILLIVLVVGTGYVLYRSLRPH
jgi:hypothetical protein